MPSLSFIATANAARYVGARPVFADVDAGDAEPDTGDRRTGADRPHAGRHPGRPGGVPADLDAMRKLCEPRGIAIVEDAACAAGAEYRGRPVGAGADVAAFSFHPRKLLTTGEGGMIVTPDGELAARLRRLREHGMDVSAAQRHASRAAGHRALSGDRLQLPDDRHPGRGRPRPTGQASGAGRPAARTGRAVPAVAGRDSRPTDDHRSRVRADQLPVLLGAAASRGAGWQGRTAPAARG